MVIITPSYLKQRLLINIKLPKNMNPTIETIIAGELSARSEQVSAAIKLLDDGATVPFIARYRKEATGSLDDIQLRLLHSRLIYLRDLEERRLAIIKSIGDQEKLTPELEKSLLAATTKTYLEDLYLPFKPKRRSKASVAREAGLQELAEKLLQDPTLDPVTTAAGFINLESGYIDEKACLDGARQILMEEFSEDAALLSKLRTWIWNHSYIQSSCLKTANKKDAQKYRDYFEYHEPINKIPSHRILALFRGRNESILQVSLMTDKEMLDKEFTESSCQTMIAEHLSITDQQRPADPWLSSVVQWTWRVKLMTHLESELFKTLKESAEVQAIDIFANNLKDLLMAAPAGQKIVMGLDPALRSGVKVVVTDVTGQLIAHTVIYPHVPQNQWSQSLRKLQSLCEMHKVSLISIGNGTGSRETERLVKELIKEIPDNKLEFMIISEAGASIYSASELASKEFPDLDVSLRGAVSIARRIQDPLSELVKIDPKSIGVGQYQHDVNQRLLSKSLDGVVEDCVNAVGVDLNIASAEVLSKVAGLSPSTAENIVTFRNEQGRFDSRVQLLEVPRLGDKAFEQCAGFLRITDGSNPLDASAVHPEAYSIVEQIIEQSIDKELKSIIGDHDFLQKIDLNGLTTEKFGLITVKDVLKELEKPGRDPRPEFKTVIYKEGVESLKDLRNDMELEGVISNVTNFGAFVDVGVHQDGLIHISQLSNTFVSDPRTIVKAGDIVKVWVLEVDVDRKRVGLTMLNPKQKKVTANSDKATDKSKNNNIKQIVRKNSSKANKSPKAAKKDVPVSAFGSLLSDALTNKK
jgi:uncharacterized protein